MNFGFKEIITRFIHGATEETFGKKVLVGTSPYEEVHSVLVDYQNSAIRRKDMKWALSTFQIHLALEIEGQRKAIKQIEAENPELDPQSPIGSIHSGAQTFLNSLYKIADGLAFRFLDFNYPLMRLLSFNTASTLKMDDLGHQHELQVFSAMSDSADIGTQVLFCGINQVTNIGDIILKNKTTFEIIEVKQNKKTRGARIRRQKERMDKIRDFFEESGMDFNGLDTKLVHYKPRVHFLAKLQDAFDKAKHEGPQLVEIADYQFVYCSYLFNVDIEKVIEDIERIAKNKFKDEPFDVYTSKDSRFGNAVLIPITSYPLKSDLICHLMLGGAIYFSVFCFSILKRLLEKDGWVVEDLTTKPEEELKKIGLPALRLSKNGNNKLDICIPLDFITSVVYELVSFDSLMESYKDPEVRFEQGAHNYTPVFQDEERLWT